MHKPTLLIIDDEITILKLFKAFLEDQNYNVIVAPDGKEGIAAFDTHKPDLIIVDLIMPEIDGFTVVKHVNTHSPDIPVIVISGIASIHGPVKALKLGAWDYLFKPIQDMTALLHAVEKCLERSSLIHQNKKYQYQLEELVMIKTEELQNANETLKESEERYRGIFENFQDIYFEVLKDGTILEISPSIFKFTGYTREELLNKNISLFFDAPEDWNSFMQIINHNKYIYDLEIILINKENEKIPFSATARITSNDSGAPSKITGTLRDITIRKNNERKIREQLKEKETLIQEVHHRVKNNMQIINSLIFMQSEFIDDVKVKQSLKQIECRVQSMALVHNQLYQSDNLSSIDLKDYIDELSNNILSSFDSNIKYKSNIKNITVSIESAIPIGLILNEIITNTVKYAFPEPKEIKILSIECLPDNTEHLNITVFDNGVGIPEDLKENKTQSLGLTLIDALVQQMNGQYEIINKNGLRYEIKVQLTNT